MKKNVLFACIHNSARSQMAEAFLKEMCGGGLEAHSAGLEPGRLNPAVVEVMREAGMDISGNRTKSVSEMLQSGKTFAYVITGLLRRNQCRTLSLLPRRRPAAALGLCRPLGISGHARGNAGEDAGGARRHPAED